MKVKFFNIKYDTDGADVDLPSELIFPLPGSLEVEDENALDDYVSECGADMISDHTGWCVFSFEHVYLL